jgi:two-component system chemotaxis response regulator CheY
VRGIRNRAATVRERFPRLMWRIPNPFKHPAPHNRFAYARGSVRGVLPLAEPRPKGVSLIGSVTRPNLVGDHPQRDFSHHFFVSVLLKTALRSDEYSVRSRMESNVLVVDDSGAIRKILQRVLRQTGMAIQTIHEAGDGQEALAVLGAHKVGLVLTDINMPKMDGLQLLAAIKASAQWRQIPVVMITTEGGESKVSEAVRLGAAGYVRKPFTADQIKEKLAGILDPALPI